MNTNSIKDHARPLGRRQASLRALTLAIAVAAFACGQQSAEAGQREQAKRMFDRLTGTAPSDPQLLAFETAIGATPQSRADAAYALLGSQTAQGFYTVVLKNFATPWTNRDQTIFAPLNDYTATVIGAVRDNRDFRNILSDDILYVGQGQSPAASATSNAHYEALEQNNVNLMTALQATTQSGTYGLPLEATAGLMTSRAASEAFFIDGTNRAMFRFTLLNHMCRDMEQMHDTTRPPDRIRQDVTRSPGGDSSVFLNNCIGCHSGMDPMAQAFAYYDFDETQGRLVYTPGAVQPKYLINSDNFKPGFVTPNDSWENRWRLPGQNKEAVGWSSQLEGRGNGAKSLGNELAHSDAFAQCQVEKVFKTICLRSPSTGDSTAFVTITQGFQSGQNAGNLKRVFAEVAAHCAGT
jgi:hypothetical protein